MIKKPKSEECKILFWVFFFSFVSFYFLDKLQLSLIVAKATLKKKKNLYYSETFMLILTCNEKCLAFHSLEIK